jgi:hypothetical protein
MPRKSRSFLPRLRGFRRGARWVRGQFARAPWAIRIAGIIAILLALLALTNLVYHVIRKPTELFFFVGHRLDKEPAETWRQYGALFRVYSTSTIRPKLLAALAQVESSGNPVDRTYWRCRWSPNPFAIYETQPVGWVERLVRRSSTSEGGSEIHRLRLFMSVGFANGSTHPTC